MPRLPIWVSGLLFAVSPVCLGPLGAVTQGEELLCDGAARDAAQKYDIPLEIMLSIARVESGNGPTQGPWPWTINANGTGHWFDTREEAANFAADQLSAGSSNFDIGCFQINLLWHPSAFSSVADALDPTANAEYAARFLSTLFEANRDWKTAVATYHSRSEDLGHAYVKRVEAAYLTLLAPSQPDLPDTSELQSARNEFPLLKGGKTSGFGSLVPERTSATALIGGTR